MLTRHVFALLTSILLTATAFAQADDPPNTSPATESDRSAEEDVRKREPRVFVLRDSQGRRVYVPDFSFERWDELIKQERNLLPARPPAYNFTGAWEIQARLHSEYVELDIDCTFELVGECEQAPGDETESAWHRVPLRFLHAIRSPDFVYDGPGRLLLAYDAGGDGHIAWVDARPGSQHRLQWKAKLPLIRRSGETRMELLAPLHPIRFQMSLPDPELDVAVGNPDEHLLQTVVSDEATRITVESVGGDLQLSWQPRDESPPVLDSTGEIHVRMVGKQLEWIASLHVRSYGQPVDRFFVQLPPDAALIPPVTAEFVMSTVSAGEQTGLIEVRRRDGRPAGEFEVTLNAIQTPASSPATPALVETSGFAVVGAVRQSGTIRFTREGDWNVDWIPGLYVRQVSDPIDRLSMEDGAARFLYDRQPFSLKVRITPQVSRTTVEPIYVVNVTESAIQLDARFRYRISGGRAKVLSFEMPDWQVDRISPDEVYVNFTQNDSLVTIELSPTAQTATDEIELRVFASRPHDGEASPLSFGFPQPQATIPAPAQVVILSAENVQLAPRAADVRGLISVASAPNLELPFRRQLPLLYQEEAIAENSTFTADLQVRDRVVNAAVHSEIQLSDSTIEVLQELNYTIEYEPLKSLTLSVPYIFAEDNRWQVTLNGMLLPASISDDSNSDAVQGESSEIDDADSDESSPARPTLQVDLLEERLGTCNLEVRFRFPVSLKSDNATPLYEVELVQPIENEFTVVEENTLQVSAAENWRLTVEDEQWSRAAAVDQPFAATSSPYYRAAGSVDRVGFAISLATPQRQSTTAIERVWVQVWLTSTVRRDRVAFRLLTNDPTIELTLPDGVQDTEVAVNGQRWQKYTRDRSRLTVELDSPTAVRHHTLEVWYSRAARSVPLGRIEVAIPQLSNAEYAERIFWQVVVPRSEHLLRSPTALTPEYVWQWSQHHWGRHSNRDQAVLEELLGASAQDDLPQVTNSYLFSSVGPLLTVDFLTGSRALLVVSLSSVVLAIGLLLIYLPRLRHPAVAVVLGLVVLSAGVVFPEPAVLASQAAILGALLILLSRLLRWFVTLGRQRSPGVYSGGGRLAAPEPPSTPTAAASGVGRPATTVTPPTYQITAVESEP